MSVLDALYKQQCSLASIQEMLRHRHIPTHMHCERVVLMADAFAKACVLPPDEHAILLYSAMLHDIGKIGIPDSILMYEGALDDAQEEVMKMHSAIGEMIIRIMALEHGDAIAAHVRHHHEHYDGHGYPDGLAGEAIPRIARMLTILDSYDALREERPYRAALHHEEAVAIMQSESGIKHDPVLLKLFLELDEIKTIGDRHGDGKADMR